MAEAALRLWLLRRETYAIGFEDAYKRVVVRFRTDLVVLKRLAVAIINSFIIKLDPLHFSATNLRQEIGIVSFLGRLAADTTETLNDRQKNNNYDDKNKNIFG